MNKYLLFLHKWNNEISNFNEQKEEHHSLLDNRNFFTYFWDRCLQLYVKKSDV